MKDSSRNGLVTKCVQLVVVAALMSTAAANSEGLEFCCGKISSDSVCNDTCIRTLSELSPAMPILNSLQFQVMSSACSPSYTSFWSCVNDSLPTAPPTTTPTPTIPPYYACCTSAETSECTQACQENFSSGKDLSASIANISTVCEFPLGKIWVCILAITDVLPTPDPDAIPTQPPYADWARVQCCYKSVADECRASCLDLYSGLISSSSWYTFQLDCIHRPSEHVLLTCLSDVSSPCKLGCSGLQFCSSLNNRPTMSFRHCTASADRMAKTSYQSWVATRVIPHPLIPLFVSNLDTCLTDMWKAVACITHVQPCHASTHATQICRDDCLKLLSRCSNSEVTPQAVCDIIAPASTREYCISLEHLLEPSEFNSRDVQRVTNPCTPNPCAEGYFCAINHRCQSDTQSCTPYSCQPGCVVGDKPSFVVSEGGGVRVALVTNSERSCYGYFNCSESNAESGGSKVTTLGGAGVAAGYSPVHLYCEQKMDCVVNETSYKHQSTYSEDCNICTCYHGRVTCTKRSCTEHNGQLQYSSCDCPMTHNPVCTFDGRTLPNYCLARCLGYSETQYRVGDCGSIDPCGGALHSVCGGGSGYKCLPNRHVCLSPGLEMAADCTQYTCVSSEGCNSLEPVCDSNNIQHSSLCTFITTQGEINYFGYCQDECSYDNTESVCGVNGETYDSRCHAENAYVAVDYSGGCTDVPGTNVLQTNIRGNCADVVCPQLPPDCVGVLSHDSCCPQCGSHLTILSDKELLKRNIDALGREFLSSADMLRKLRYQISSLECELFGHVSLDDSVSVWVLPTQRLPDNLMVMACNAEAVKLATFINNQTPMLASDPILSHLVAAEVVSTDFLSSVQTTHPNGPGTLPGGRDGAVTLIPSVVLTALLLLLTF